MENQDYKNKNIKAKYLENMRNNQFSKIKDSLLKLEKIFMELKGRREKIKIEIIKEKLFQRSNVGV